MLDRLLADLQMTEHVDRIADGVDPANTSIEMLA
jgi:hypothetical protein